MSHRRNVTKLAAKVGLSNDGSLREQDLTVSVLRIWDKDGKEVQIHATRENRTGRLLFQYLIQAGNNCLVWNESLAHFAAGYFGDLWDNRDNPLIKALRTADVVEVLTK